MLEEFNRVFTIKYHNNQYIALKSVKRKYYYFLKEGSNNKYEYPALSDFIALNKMILSNKKFLNMENNRIENSDSKNYKFNIIPKVIYKGAAIILSTIMILAVLQGCSNEHSLNTNDIDNIVSTSLSESDQSQIEEISVSGIDNVIEYLDVINPSSDDLIECVKNNPKIDQHTKELLYDGIRNLGNNLPNLRLDILYKNLTNIEIIYENSTTNSVGEDKKEVVGYYSPTNNCVYINSNMSEEQQKNTLYHEVFGHGSGSSIFYKDNKKICYLFEQLNSSLINYTSELKSSNLYSKHFGYSIDEARADIVSCYAMSKEELASRKFSYYEFDQILLLLLHTNDISIDELSNNGISLLIEKVCSKNIDCFELINNLDCYSDYLLTNATDLNNNYRPEKNREAYIYKYLKYLVSNGYSLEAAIADTDNKILKDNYFEENKQLGHNYTVKLSLLLNDIKLTGKSIDKFEVSGIDLGMDDVSIIDSNKTK